MTETIQKPAYNHRLLDQVRYYFHEKPKIFPDTNYGISEYHFIKEIMSGKNPFLNKELIRLPVFLSEHQYTISEIPESLQEEILLSNRSLRDIQNIFEYSFHPDRWPWGCSVMISPKGLIFFKKQSEHPTFNIEVNYEKKAFNFAIWGKCRYNREEYERHYLIFQDFDLNLLNSLKIYEFMEMIKKKLIRTLKRIEIISEEPFQYRI